MNYFILARRRLKRECKVEGEMVREMERWKERIGVKERCYTLRARN